MPSVGIANQRPAMTAAFAAFEPGKRDRDISASAEAVCLAHGSEQGLYMCASYPAGKGSFFANRHYQNRVIEHGDEIAVLIESAGAGGYYCELGRTAIMGKASAAQLEQLAFVREARQFMLDRLKPGAECKPIWDAYNVFMAANGRPLEDRLHCHSMGVDMVERPLVRFDEPMLLAANMVMSCHPTFDSPNGLHWLCDDYLITETGCERLHAFPETITEL